MGKIIPGILRKLTEMFSPDEKVINDADNMVMVSTQGDYIYIMCHTDKQMDKVMDRMFERNCVLDGFEEWDEDEDRKFILTFKVFDSPVIYN
tara:strand:- start:190 stop:465 length:276 start_codon:yes stop_codon:yes gene_type:complete